MDMIIPERLRPGHWEGYHQTMATGITQYGTDLLRVPAVDKQGRAMSIAFTVAMLHTADGKVSAIASVIDIARPCLSTAGTRSKSVPYLVMPVAIVW